MINYKLYFKYILLNFNQLYFNYIFKNNHHLNLFILKNTFYYTILHFKLSSLFYSTQLTEIFVYEILTNNLKKNTFSKIASYNFHNILFNYRFFLFVLTINEKKIKTLPVNSTLPSITELFPNANWLEREMSELHQVFFEGKKDLRNLMLQYGDNSAPMIKSYPSIGTREIFYDSSSDLLIQQPTSIQF